MVINIVCIDIISALATISAGGRNRGSEAKQKRLADPHL